MDCEQSLTQFAEIVNFARARCAINASLSTAFGCPFEGQIPVARVFELIERFVTLNIQRVTLCDTTGMANPIQVEQLCRQARTHWPQVQFTAHFHNTRGMGLANALAALDRKSVG